MTGHFAGGTDHRMETIYVVCHKSEHGKRHYPVAAYRREVDAINEKRAIDHHTSEGSVTVDKVTLDGAVSQDLETGRSAYTPREKARSVDTGIDRAGGVDGE
jgi:hypothetical protein